MSAAPPTFARKKSSWTGLIIIGAVISLVVLGMVGLFLGMYEWWGVRHEGTEFNPTTFEIRRYDYRSGIITGNQRANLNRMVSTTKLSALLRQLKYLPPRNAQQWDLAEHDQIENLREGIALPLVIQLRDVGFNDRWTAWTQNHPKESAVLWPAVVELANEGCYGDIAPLLEKFSQNKIVNPARIADQHLQEAYQRASQFASSDTQRARYENLAGQAFSTRNFVAP